MHRRRSCELVRLVLRASVRVLLRLVHPEGLDLLRTTGDLLQFVIDVVRLIKPRSVQTYPLRTRDDRLHVVLGLRLVALGGDLDLEAVRLALDFLLHLPVAVLHLTQKLGT